MLRIALPTVTKPLVTVVVPSFNQGRFLDEALTSIFQQDVPVEVFVMDGGSTDNSLEVIRQWAPRLAGWRSHADAGQSAAINEGIALGRAPYVCWLNSDDWYLAGGLRTLLTQLEQQPDVPMVYGRTWNCDAATGQMSKVFVQPFSVWLMAQMCIISQPATLLRRKVWQTVGGVDATLHMAMDYDLWWRVFRQHGCPVFVDAFVAVNRVHQDTKTNTQRHLHYVEAMAVVRRHYGRVPMKWWLAWPYAVWWRSLRRSKGQPI